MMVKEQMKIILKGVSDFVNEKELSDKLERAQKKRSAADRQAGA